MQHSFCSVYCIDKRVYTDTPEPADSIKAPIQEKVNWTDISVAVSKLGYLSELCGHIVLQIFSRFCSVVFIPTLQSADKLLQHSGCA